MVEFGVRLPNSGPLATADSILSSAEVAEKLGFNSVWVHDHITWGTEQHRDHLSSGSAEALKSAQLPNFYESLITLATIAGRTRSVKLGVAVVILPLRNPVVFAKQTSVLDALSGGRLLVGVAPGAPKITEKEFETVGVDYHKRGRITDDYIRAVKKLWTEPLPTYDGKFVSFSDVQMFPKPLQKPHPPILIGGGERGLSDIALKRVVGLGNGWIPAYLTERELGQGAKQLREGALNAGRGTEKFIIGLEMFTGLGPSDNAARDTYATTLTKNFVSVEEGMKRSLVGTSKTITQRMESYANAGLDYVELKFMYSTVSEFHEAMDTFAKDVIPSFG
ncbi:MAG: TIGR03619 family F420-dependent LLM class oxidoreductase [Candidatus Bathyarchaeia archaeon]|jgi:probable F420-dependent oxidoreductase